MDNLYLIIPRDLFISFGVNSSKPSCIRVHCSENGQGRGGRGQADDRVWDHQHGMRFVSGQLPLNVRSAWLTGDGRIDQRPRMISSKEDQQAPP